MYSDNSGRESQQHQENSSCWQHITHKLAGWSFTSVCRSWSWGQQLARSGSQWVVAKRVVNKVGKLVKSILLLIWSFFNDNFRLANLKSSLGEFVLETFTTLTLEHRGQHKCLLFRKCYLWQSYCGPNFRIPSGYHNFIQGTYSTRSGIGSPALKKAHEVCEELISNISEYIVYL